MSSRKPPLKLSPKARQDIVDILRYTGETWGQNQLLVYRDKINAALEVISHTPEIGHGHNDLPLTHLAYLVGSHIIVYRIRTDSIGIVRILKGHGVRSCLLLPWPSIGRQKTRPDPSKSQCGHFT